MNLRQATRDSIDRAIAAFEDATKHDPEYARAWAALGGAYGLKGSFLSIPDMRQAGDRDWSAGRSALDPDLADAHMWLGASLLGIGQTDEAIAEIREALRLDPENGQAYQTLARAYWVGNGDFKAAIPLFERAIALNPEAGYSYLQLSLLLAWEGQLDRAEEISRRAVELQEQYISGNLGLQIVGAHARLGYVHYLKGEYAEALREYEREMAFIGAGDHALRDRTPARTERQDRRGLSSPGPADDAERHFGRALKSFDSRVANGADDPFTRYYIACLHALRGDRDRALDSLERVANSLPKLTAARARVDVDLVSLREEPRFLALEQVSDDSGPHLRVRSCPVTSVPSRPLNRNSTRDTYDVIIVGAGPAGLSAALILGRARRTVLVCDSGQSAQCCLTRASRLPDARRHCAA